MRCTGAGSAADASEWVTLRNGKRMRLVEYQKAVRFHLPPLHQRDAQADPQLATHHTHDVQVIDLRTDAIKTAAKGVYAVRTLTSIP